MKKQYLLMPIFIRLESIFLRRFMRLSLVLSLSCLVAWTARSETTNIPTSKSKAPDEEIIIPTARVISQSLSQNKTNAFDQFNNEITTRDGTVYKGVTVQRVDPDGLTIGYSPAGGGIGVAKLKFENLPDYLQRKFGYNPDKAAAYEARQAKGMAEWLKQQRPDAKKAKFAATELAEQIMPEQQAKKAKKATVGVPLSNVEFVRSIEKVLDDGNIIELEDGSLWQVDPLDTIDSALWSSLENIVVIEGDGIAYPFKLINKDNNEVVNAKRIQLKSTSEISAPSQVTVASDGKTEEVTIVKVFDSDDKAIIQRSNGERYLIEYGVGVLSIWRYEGKRTLVYSPGLFLGVGSKILLPEDGQTAKIWSSKQIGN